jgi:tetratricopeptide (TPR) repeat protein
MSEKNLSSLTRDLRGLYTKGNEALARDNLDYAISLFCQVLSKEPGLYEVRKALRTAQTRHAGSGGGFFKKMLGTASSSGLIAKAQIGLRSDPLEALATAEQILTHDPNSSAAHRIVVEAARALEMPHTAAMSLEVLHKNSPRDRDTAIQFANALAEVGEALRAERVLSALYAEDPSDLELAQALKDLSARKTLDEGGYEALADGTGSYRDILKDKEGAVALEQENRQVRTEDTAARLIREYEERLREQPSNIKLLRDLAELYTQKKEFDRALEYYQRIRSTDVGQDANLEKAITETTVRKYNDRMEQLDPNSLDYAEARAALEAERQAYELDSARKLTERFPTDLQLRFELGRLCFEQGKISEAIQEFQKSQANPHRRVASLSYLGQCFAKRKMYDIAERTLQAALKEKAVFDDEKKELVYNLGCVQEGMGKKEAAVEQFKLIYEVDIGYRDVGAKVDAFYAGQ